MKIRLFSALLSGLFLSSCNPLASDPTADDLARLFGIPVSDVSCVAAEGMPGRMCSFMSGNDNFTRRIIKLDNGRWKALDT